MNQFKKGENTLRRSGLAQFFLFNSSVNRIFFDNHLSEGFTCAERFFVCVTVFVYFRWDSLPSALRIRFRPAQKAVGWLTVKSFLKTLAIAKMYGIW
jgi:hypothetical protein